VSGVTLQTGKTTGAFNVGTKQTTIQTLLGASLCTTSVFNYDSVADFVDEVRVVPGVTLTTSNTNTNSGACGPFSTTVTYAYDGQRRLKTMASIGGTTTYTAWDSSGRPTAGTTSTGITITNVYDNAARTLTQTQVASNGGQSVNVQTFDANGIQLKVVNTDSSGTSTTTYTNTSTAQVCK
jgi:YD repeat-containing protein